MGPGGLAPELELGEAGIGAILGMGVVGVAVEAVVADEQLLGHGDMLFLPPGTGFPVRVHGAFVSDQEVQRVTNQLRQGGAPAYLDNVVNVEFESDFSSGGVEGGDGDGDPLYDRALAFVTGTRRASISSVQRQLRVGYNRAARMIEAMEMAGVVGPLENGKREVLASAPPE